MEPAIIGRSVQEGFVERLSKVYNIIKIYFTDQKFYHKNIQIKPFHNVADKNEFNSKSIIFRLNYIISVIFQWILIAFLNVFVTFAQDNLSNIAQFTDRELKIIEKGFDLCLYYIIDSNARFLSII